MSDPRRILRLAAWAYIALFLAYLLLPLVYMMVAAFNASRFPSVAPWRGFTWQWFGALFADSRLWQAVWSSTLIGVSVIPISIVLGLGGALFFTRTHAPGRSLVYAILVSPVLAPGIVIGLSTAIFWDRVFDTAGFWGMSVVAQASFISAYCMFIFMARLQRFDLGLEEAALDLGATPWQAFRMITLPYLRPAIYSAAALAFLQSFENFNTTLFTIGNDHTLPIYIAAKVRQGVTPAVNALACVMVSVTILGALAYEIVRRRGVGIAAPAAAR